MSSVKLILHRRDFIKTASAASAGILFSGSLLSKAGSQAQSGEDNLLTVTGMVAANSLNIILPHEHILSQFGMDADEPGRYDEEHVLNGVIPYLKYIKSLGCDAIACCTTAFFGRNAALLKKISEQSGMYIIVNTGYYGAAGDRYVPKLVTNSKPEQIAEIWINEWKNGIGTTGIKPGFVKTAVDEGPLSDTDFKLVEAAAITHAETGLTLAVHTGNNQGAAKEQLEILKKHKVHPSAWIWVHAQSVADTEILIEYARQGAWISLDHLITFYYLDGKTKGEHTLPAHFNHLSRLKAAGVLDRVLLAHDGSIYPAQGEDWRPMDVLMNSFIPMMQASGFSKDEIRMLTVTNPARALSIGKKMI